MKTQKQCPVCGEPFTPKRVQQKFCSRKCQIWNNSHREQICKVCGGIFIGSNGIKYCSKECRSKGISLERSKNLLTQSSEKKFNKNASLREKVDMANKQHISYGELVAKDYRDRYARVEVHQ